MLSDGDAIMPSNVVTKRNIALMTILQVLYLQGTFYFLCLVVTRSAIEDSARN
jgi:hypothetical protein